MRKDLEKSFSFLHIGVHNIFDVQTKTKVVWHMKFKEADDCNISEGDSL